MVVHLLDIPSSYICRPIGCGFAKASKVLGAVSSGLEMSAKAESRMHGCWMIGYQDRLTTDALQKVA